MLRKRIHLFLLIAAQLLVLGHNFSSHHHHHQVAETSHHHGHSHSHGHSHGQENNPITDIFARLAHSSSDQITYTRPTTKVQTVAKKEILPIAIDFQSAATTSGRSEISNTEQLPSGEKNPYLSPHLVTDRLRGPPVFIVA